MPLVLPQVQFLPAPLTQMSHLDSTTVEKFKVTSPVPDSTVHFRSIKEEPHNPSHIHTGIYILTDFLSLAMKPGQRIQQDPRNKIIPDAPNTYTHRNAHTQAHGNTHIYSQAQYTHTGMHTPRHTATHTCILTGTHRNAHTQAHSNTCKHILTGTHRNAHTQPHSNKHKHILQDANTQFS